MFITLVMSPYLIADHSITRPETTSVTAHRLVSGALGVSTKMDSEKLKEEKEKLAFAKGDVFACDMNRTTLPGPLLLGGQGVGLNYDPEPQPRGTQVF